MSTVDKSQIYCLLVNRYYEMHAKVIYSDSLTDQIQLAELSKLESAYSNLQTFKESNGLKMWNLHRELQQSNEFGLLINEDGQIDSGFDKAEEIVRNQVTYDINIDKDGESLYEFELSIYLSWLLNYHIKFKGQEIIP